MRPTHLLPFLCAALSLFLVTPARAASGSPAPEHGSGTLALIINAQVSHDQYLAHSEPAIAENPRNPRNLIAGSKFFTDPAHYQFKIGTYYSKDGGRTWHDNGFLPGFASYASTSDISIAFDSKGTAYVAVLACDLSGTMCHGKSQRSGIFVLKSIDGGKSFSAPVPVILDTSGATFSDKPWIAVDQSRGPLAGTIYVAWNLDSNSSMRKDPDAGAVHLRDLQSDSAAGIVVSHSRDGGKTFSSPVLVAAFTAQQSFLGAIPAVGPDGSVYAVFSSLDENNVVNSLSMVKSTDGGATFSAPTIIQSKLNPLPNHLPNSTFRNFTLPTFAISPADGTLMVGWADQRNGDADIFTIRSRNGGIDWSIPYRVNHDTLLNGKDQFQPALAVAPNGTFTCSWFDRRRDPENRLIDVDIAQSRDDGTSFGKNIRVTRQSWDPAVGAPIDDYQNTFIGDYQALAVDNSTVHPLWNDTQNGQSQEIRTAIMPVKVFQH